MAPPLTHNEGSGDGFMSVNTPLSMLLDRRDNRTDSLPMITTIAWPIGKYQTKQIPTIIFNWNDIDSSLSHLRYWHFQCSLRFPYWNATDNLPNRGLKVPQVGNLKYNLM